MTVGATFYERATGPLWAGLLLLMGVAPLSVYGRTSWNNLGRAAWKRAAVSLLVAVAVVALGVRNVPSVPGYWLVGLVVAVVAYEFWRGALARRKLHGENLLLALGRLAGRNRRRYGGYIIHWALWSWPWESDREPSEGYEFPFDLVKVDSEPDTATPPPERIYPLADNVSEWVVWVADDCDRASCHQAWDGESDSIAMMGGAYDRNIDRITAAPHYFPHVSDLSTGFRCAADSVSESGMEGGTDEDWNANRRIGHVGGGELTLRCLCANRVTGQLNGSCGNQNVFTDQDMSGLPAGVRIHPQNVVCGCRNSLPSL